MWDRLLMVAGVTDDTIHYPSDQFRPDTTSSHWFKMNQFHPKSRETSGDLLDPGRFSEPVAPLVEELRVDVPQGIRRPRCSP